MIRLRAADGRIIETEVPIAAIEICSSDGKVAQVFIESGPRIMRFTSKDKEMKDYCRAVDEGVAREIHITSEGDH